MKLKRKYCVSAGLSLSALLTPLASSQTFDVFFLADTTGSMGSLITSVQDASSNIITNFSSRGDVRFGVGEYKDAASDAFGFRYNLADMGNGILSSDNAAITAAINQWNPSGGGDFPEDNLHGLRETAASTPWREGSRRIIFWFGDAPGSDPARDGTTLATTLAALSAECVQVIAFDLGSLDDTGQATAVTTQTLESCGLNGGVLEPVDEVPSGDEIDDVLNELFERVAVGPQNPALLDSGARLIGVSMARTMSRDVGGRLSRLRAGGPGDLSVTQTAPTAIVSDSKSGLSKGVIPGQTIVTDRWHAWGEIYAFTEEFDEQRSGFAGTANFPISPETDLDIYGGTVGVDYRLDANWTIGLGLGAARGDAELEGVADIDVDSLAVMPYLSYYQKNALGGADLYADFMYAYVDNEYDISPAFGAGFDADGTSHQFELNTGLNYTTGNLIHGPYLQVRYLDGEIDGGPDFESFATQLGYQVSSPMAMSGGTLIPSLRVGWEHEFESDEASIAGASLGALDEDIIVAGVGAQYLLDSGVNLGVNYQGRFGSDSESHYVSLNAGFRF